MGILQWLGLTREASNVPRATDERSIPSLTNRQSVTVAAAYRAIQVLTTAAGQLSFDVERGGQKIAAPPLVRRPDSDLTRSEWVESVVTSMATAGNAYLHHDSGNNLRVWNPHQVMVWRDRDGRKVFTYRGKDYRTEDGIRHLAMMRLPGSDLGIGPLESARRGLTFAHRSSDYTSRWFDTTGQPAGILTSEASVNAIQARELRNAWNQLDAEGNPIEQDDNPSRVRVLGRGFKYEPLLLKPSDVLWLEAQNWSTVEVARVFGCPSSLMLVGVEGKSSTYANVNQEWLAFVRFTLMGYMRRIEDALTDLSPNGQTVRVNLEGLLRADTITRYESYKLAIGAGWLDADEVRTIEGLTPRKAQAQ